MNVQKQNPMAFPPFACPLAPLHPIWGLQAQYGDMAEGELPPKSSAVPLTVVPLGLSGTARSL